MVKINLGQKCYTSVRKYEVRLIKKKEYETVLMFADRVIPLFFAFFVSDFPFPTEKGCLNRGMPIIVAYLCICLHLTHATFFSEAPSSLYELCT